MVKEETLMMNKRSIENTEAIGKHKEERKAGNNKEQAMEEKESQ